MIIINMMMMIIIIIWPGLTPPPAQDVSALGLEESDVRKPLSRLCMVRSFWRLQHAITTSHWGGACDPSPPAGHLEAVFSFASGGSLSVPDTPADLDFKPPVFGRQASTYITAAASAKDVYGINLAPVASHPLTCHMADSIASLVMSLNSRTELPLAIVSRLERKGKFLQLILHSLTLDNEGDTGALAVLAACVMSVHMLLIWARRDMAAIKRLMIKDEGFADHDPAAALSWLMQACRPPTGRVIASVMMQA